MAFLFEPGVALMHRLQNKAKLPLLALLFSVPPAILYFAAESALPGPAVAAAAGALVFACYCTASIYLQVERVRAQLIALIRRIAEGDLTAKIDGSERGQFGPVLGAIDDVNRNLGQIVSTVRAAAQSISLSAEEIAAGNTHLSNRTEQQASALEETASGMEELAATVRQNAESCKNASGLAQNAEEVARRGAGAMHDVVEGMTRIDRGSRRMADIIGVIEGIAFQTNILALNAAVEAARAGEQGRGFAVVAAEVRALAQRCANAASEIRMLIEESAGQVSAGTGQAEGAGKVIDEIVASVQQVNRLIGEIAVASTEQEASVAEINKAIVQLEGMTQQNAALVEQAAAASLAFQDQAERMRDMASRFRTAGEDPVADRHAEAGKGQVRSPAAPVPAERPLRLVTRPSPRALLS